jgi:uncharacterized damage-inducible protein DinB
MITAQDLITAYARNSNILHRQVAGLTHADSLLQLPFQGNCLNWTVGHIVDALDSILHLLGEPTVFTPEQSARYGYGSEAVTCEEPGVVQLETLLVLYDQANERIAAALTRCSAQSLEVEVHAFGQTMSLGQAVFYQYFHTTYHTGQTELLRQLAGVGDKVI